ncbi:eukaryotic initiation factor 4A-6 [Aplysia californica]|uniref:RNA helicase n=1 Tax=Aplysia californica TaxID=6500 RepID=A0ABM1W045_APLCA|nr:eukaryotic initiation factor 4A-6 [Aplysia californica]
MSEERRGSEQDRERFSKRESTPPLGGGGFSGRENQESKRNFAERKDSAAGERKPKEDEESSVSRRGESLDDATERDDRPGTTGWGEDHEGERTDEEDVTSVDDGFSDETKAVGMVQLFDDMNLKSDLLRGIYGMGFEFPSPIQQKAIMPAIQGRDVIAQAQSGTGKTATFSISILERLDVELNACQALVLSPTRELAHQTWRVMNCLGDYMGVNIHASIGGSRLSSREDARRLQAGVHVVVGTPGRVLDMIANHRGLDPRDIRIFVLDEADVMLSRGFKDAIYDIFKYLPVDVQVMIVSATLPQEVLAVTENFMRAPVRILVKQEQLTLEGIRQFYVQVEKEEFKLATLCDLYETLTISQSVIFCNLCRKVDWLTRSLKEKDFTVSAIHGEMDQRERDLVMQEFVSGSSRVLLCTDLLARGVDVQQVSMVLNFDLPTDRENYIHRIGRGGRFGRKGVAINFITRDDVRKMKDIEQFYNTCIQELPSDVADFI